MSEPEFLSRNGEATDADRRREWFKARAAEASAKGARWHRFSFEAATNLSLYEGWKTRPDSEGDPRFQLINGPAGAL